MPPKTKHAEDNSTEIQQLTAKKQILSKLLFQTEATLRSGSERKIGRLREQMQSKVDECFSLVTEISEMKLINAENEEEVTSWMTTQQDDLEVYEMSLQRFDTYFTDLRSQMEEEEKQKLAEAADLRRREAIQLEKAKFEEKKNLEIQLEREKLKRLQEEKSKAKLPKLEISKFDGTFVDWLRFWQQFEEEIDSCNSYAAVTKFSYLQELLSELPKSEVIGLPFTEEGYRQAKDILKKKYGVTSEIVHAHGKNILKLPIIYKESNTQMIHEFYRSLNVSVNSLKTMQKLDTAEILVRETLEKLGPIKAELTRSDPDWQSWNLENLLGALREYIVRNPVESNERGRDRPSRNGNMFKEKQFQAQNKGSKKIRCVYCNSEKHFSSVCEKVKTTDERRAWFKKKRLCYNCAGPNHSVRECRSRSCAKCNQRHHTSLCNLKEEDSNNPDSHMGGGGGANNYRALSVPDAKIEGGSLFMMDNIKETIHPTLVAIVNGQKFRMLLDTGAGSSFISTTLANHLGTNPAYWEYKSMETMTSVVKQKLPVYNIQILSTDKICTLDIKVSKLDRPVLTTLSNPRITLLKSRYPYLEGLKFDNEDDKPNHPIHIILGAGDIARIKSAGLIYGKPGNPVAENSLFGWTLIGQGEKPSNINYFANTVQDDYRQLYSLDVLGLQDQEDGNQQNVYGEFKEQLRRNDDGSYSTRLPWVPNHPDLKDNSVGALARLKTLIRKLKKTPALLKEYHDIIQLQLKEGILESASEIPSGEHVYYMPHRAVIRENAETTKIRIVGDMSASPGNGFASLNDCLHVGPPLQPHLQHILIRNRLKPIVLLGDIKQAFLQIWVEECDRDALRLYWVKDLIHFETVTLRFVRVPFGCTSSPFILGGTIHEHLEQNKIHYPDKRDVIMEIKRDIMVDDLVSGSITLADAHYLKETAKSIFKEAKFDLHKWHSNFRCLEEENEEYKSEAKILGIFWEKEADLIGVDFKNCKQIKEMSKRGVLRSMASVYDPLGITSPLLLVAKQLYRNICERKLSWDGTLGEFETAWIKWQKLMPDMVKVPRCIPIINLPITGIELHGFGDASKEGCCSAVYVVIHQGDNSTKGLLTANSRISKKDLTIPRLELIAGHMVANSLYNVREALVPYPINAMYGWLDSTVALYWIRSTNNEWKQFVSNRVAKIKKKENIEWRHCPTADNPADVGSRGVHTLPPIWFEGPTWLHDPNLWPNNIVENSVPKEVNIERKRTVVKSLLVSDTNTTNTLYGLLNKFSSLTKLIRVTAWIRRFIVNTKKKDQLNGGLSIEEINDALKYWIKVVQLEAINMNDYQLIAKRLNVVMNADGMLICMGRISGEYPIYLPTVHTFTELIIKHAHCKTSHGLTGLTMAEVRKNYWVEKLRSRVKSVIAECALCRRYHCKPYGDPKLTTLPKFRTTPSRAFENVGVDFAGPFEYKTYDNEFGKAYICLYTCAVSRAIHLDLLEDMAIEQFRRSLKEFIARRGNPALIISDNAKTFENTAKWLRNWASDPEITGLLVDAKAVWKFNLSRTPWWGGFFERMVGLTKRVLFKSLGRARLSFKALREVVLHVEVILNNRPLGYVEDDIQLPVLTPNMIIHGTNITLPDDKIETDPEFNEPEPTKLARELKRRKDSLWCRWKDEYLRALRERHDFTTGNICKISIGDIVLIKNEDKSRGKWKLGLVTKLIQRDGVTLGAKLKTKENTVMERSVQQLYPLELHTDMNYVDAANDDVNTNKFTKRPVRIAKSKAAEAIKSIVNDE